MLYALYLNLYLVPPTTGRVACRVFPTRGLDDEFDIVKVKTNGIVSLNIVSYGSVPAKSHHYISYKWTM